MNLNHVTPVGSTDEPLADDPVLKAVWEAVG